MEKDKQIGFKLPAKKLLQLGKEAERKGQTIAGYVRQILYEKLDQAEKTA